MIEFELPGGVMARVGDIQTCPVCASLNIWDGECSDCGYKEPPHVHEIE